MKSTIKGGAAFGYVEVELDPGETLIAESDAMSSMSADIDVTPKLNGGFFVGLARKFLGGESLFINHYSNPASQTRTIHIVQPTPGEIRKVDLNDESLFLQPGAFLACTPEIKLGLKWAGLVSFIAREGLFKYVVKGTGSVWYGAYGALIEQTVDGETIVDTSHLVAYEPGLKLKLQLASGLFSSFFSGEGLVTRVEGHGKMVIQTRSPTGLVTWLNPKL